MLPKVNSSCKSIKLFGIFELQDEILIGKGIYFI